MAGLFEAQVTNLGKYNEGVLAGEPLTFPTSPQAVQALLKDIGVDGIRYEEIFIACYDFGGVLPELQGSLGEYESLDELNHLACLLSELSPDDLAKFSAALSMGTHTSNLTDIINLAENLAGKKVLVIDCDPQSSLSISLGHSKPDTLPVTLSDMMGKVLNDQPIAPSEGILHHSVTVENTSPVLFTLVSRLMAFTSDTSMPESWISEGMRSTPSE